ncbi:MAG: VCBS repeat-containing protein, partial [Planctomycetaceae bacterium]
LARDAWADTVWDMVGLSGYGVNVRRPIDPEAIVNWYQQRAPVELQLPRLATASDTRLVAGATIPLHVGDPDSKDAKPPFVSSVSLSDIVGDAGYELLVCDMRNGSIVMADHSPAGWELHVVGRVPHPAHAEVADLDADGHQDIVVANLGSAHALDHVLGSVEWFRQRAGGGFEQITLIKDLGRVADVQPADLDRDGDVDLIVAEFGWRTTGKLFWLENSMEPQGKRRFVERPLDGLRGASHVDVADLNGDGRLEIIALFSQQHERIRVYHNRLPDRFEVVDVHQAPHPAWGYSGMQCVDMDQDGDVDILLTNGDTFDDLLLKPYHGIQWLEQREGFQFVVHDVAALPAAYCAEAVDLDGDGDRDIVACTFAEGPDLRDGEFESLVWWERTSKESWLRHSLDANVLNHPTLTVGDIDGDGDPDVLVGQGTFGALAQPDAERQDQGVEIWENRLNTSK